MWALVYAGFQVGSRFDWVLGLLKRKAEALRTTRFWQNGNF